MRFLVFLLIFCFVVPVKADAIPSVSASSACLIDAESGRILYEKDAYSKKGMASTTKIMTAIVALEKGNPETVITVSENAAATEGSSIWLETGEKMKLSDLIYGLMLASGNDAAVAIAEGVGGSVDGFVSLMNEKAKEIGAFNTSFQNPNGLTAENHYTTAYDLALITRYAMQNEVFREVVAAKTKIIPWEGSQWDRTLKNHNKLLDMYEGCTGGKTGFTKACGRCLVSTAERDGKSLICVTLNDPNDWLDHQNLLDFGFENFYKEEPFLKGQILDRFSIDSEETIELSAEKGVAILVQEEERELITVTVEKDVITLPIEKGEILGKAQVRLGEEIIEEINLVSTKEYKRNPTNEMWKRFNQLILEFFTRK